MVSVRGAEREPTRLRGPARASGDTGGGAASIFIAEIKLQPSSSDQEMRARGFGARNLAVRLGRGARGKNQ